MKNAKPQKLISVALSVLMLLSVIVPGTVFTASAAGNFPAPILNQTPQLLKEFATPDVTIPTTNFSENYNPSFSGSVESDAPAIGTITAQAGPNDSVSITGTSLSGASVYAYGLIDGIGVIKQLKLTQNKSDFINAVIDHNFQYSMYMIWVQGANGKLSAPVRVNAPQLSWTNATKASQGSELRIYGKFLTTNNEDGENAQSYVFLTDGTSYYSANVTEASPYRVTVNLPTGIEDGNYKIIVHNGHGGDYGWSNSLSLQINSSANSFWQTDSSYTKTVSVTNGMATDDDIKNAINSATAGGTIYFPAGTYVIRDKISVSKSLRFVGESKDTVKIVAVFAQTKSDNDALAYGDLNVNGSCTAAFEVSKTPCEFSNLTFIDYVNGSTLYSGVTAPTNYNIDYAHGMFIKANNTTDTGVSAQLKIDNCNFKVQRVHSDAKGCVYLSSSKQEEYHQEFESEYDFYSRSAYASAPLWIETDRSEITNCYFETPKEIITRGMQNGYIHGNTFVGTWIIAGNSGPSAIHDNQTQNLDISNNRIMGMDELTDPQGYVVTGDQTFARTIVFQKTLGVAKNQYIMNNNISRVGELNYNSGEHILFEEEGVTYVGKVTLSNDNKTLHLKDMPTDKWTSDNKFEGYVTGDNGQIKPAGYTRNVVGQVVIISKGTGAGQWRTVVTVAADRTITVDRDWDVQPDANSTFVVAPGFITPVVYNNTIQGPKMYYKNYNSTNGVNAYGTMVGTVIDRNNFSQMQAGIVLNPHYNMKSYTYNGNSVSVDFGFVMFSDLLVMNNNITDTRYGVWNFPSITIDAIDASDAEPAVNLQLGSIIRSNDISDQRRLLIGAADTNPSVDNNVMKRGGVAIVVGRDYWNSDQVLSTRYWMNDVVVENNILSNVENGYIDISYSQNGTILRNNSCDGKGNLNDILVEHNPTPHNSGKPIAQPIYNCDYGSFSEGMHISADNVHSLDDFTNGNFNEGLKYFAPLSLIGDAGDIATVITEANNTYIKVSSDSGIRTVKFTTDAVPEGAKLAVIYDIKGSESTEVSVLGDSLTGDPTNSKILAEGSALSGFTRMVSGYMTASSSEPITVYLKIQGNGFGESFIDNLKLAYVYETEGYYITLDGIDGSLLEVPGAGGTEADGMIADSTLEPSIKILNTDFSKGFKYWSDATGTALASSNASVDSGIVTIDAGVGNGIKSSAFKFYQDDMSVITEENKVAFIVKYTGSVDFKLKLYVNGVSKGNATADLYSADNLMLCYYPNVYWNTSDTYHLAITSNFDTATVSIDYVHIARCKSNNLLLDLVNYKPYNYRYGELTEGEDINNVKTPVFYNNDFSSGLDYWRTVWGTASVTDGVAAINSAKFQSVHFLPSVLRDGDTIAVLYKIKSVDGSVKITLNKKTVLQSSSADALISGITTTVTSASDTYEFTNTAIYTQEENTYSYLSVILTGTAEIDYISVVKIEGSGINLVYTDVATGKRYLSDMRDPDGTAETGYEKLGRKYQENETYAINETLMNGDFSEGLKYWSVAINSSGYASQEARVNGGVLTLTPSADGGKGVSSAHFKIPNAVVGNKVRIVYDYYHIVGTNTAVAYYQYVKAAVFKGAAHEEVKSSLNSANGGAWQTKQLEITIADPDDFYTVSFETFDKTTVCKLKNIRIVYVD